MQRKNNFLGAHKKARRGFAMIMAIAVLVVIGTIMALSLALTASTTKQTTDLYLYEQAILLSKSATEYAILEITKANPCTVTNLNFDEGVYNINVDIKYIYTNPSPCASTVDNYVSVATPEQNGSVLMDVTVVTNEGGDPISFFRRSIQKL